MPSNRRSSIFDRVIQTVEGTGCRTYPTLSRSTELSRDLALGRLGRLKLAIGLEEAFGLELENNVVAQFVSLGDIVDYVFTHTADYAASS